MTRVLIVGGGVGGLETALALRALAGDRVGVTMLAPERHFTYRPLSVNEPFGRGATVRVEVAAVADEQGFVVVRDALDRVDAAARQVVTQDGRRIDYDVLVLALGAFPVASVPGALTFRGPRDADRLARALEDLPDHPRIDFAVPVGVTWALPLYELALLAAAYLAERGRRALLTLYTPEREPLEAFGPGASAQVSRLLGDRGVRLVTGSPPPSGDLADLTVALPVLQGPAVSGLPCDRDGFVPVDARGRVSGVEGVYAVGDMADWPVKQGGLATQQADLVAAEIAASAGAAVERRPYEPVLRGLLLTGGAPLYLRNPPAEAPASGAEAPWWPEHKIVGRHLGPYLATHGDLMVAGYA